MKQLVLICTLAVQISWAQESRPWQGKFEQLGQQLPTPNEYRTGAGAPGPSYWQQKADYVIQVELNDELQQITGSETVTYHNNSPETMRYLWLQVDQNILSKNNQTSSTKTWSLDNTVDAKSISSNLDLDNFDGGYKIKSVKSSTGSTLPYSINNTMMRIDLPQPLKAGEKISFSVEWNFNIADRMVHGLRSGMEYFPIDGNYLYTMAQFFPRMCVFDDVEGWQNKQYLGNGEFALPFGDYKVSITVPADHIVGATGEIQNPKDVLTKTQLERFEKAKSTFDKPVIIVSQAEAEASEKTKVKTKKTWQFEAENVRDFAFVSSRKFIWDGMAVKVGNKTTLAMSLYPKEGNPLWELESTKAVKNTLLTYSKYTIDYPYPVAYSVHTASLGMEYPMICFNYGRPKPDGSYTDATKYGMIGVIIHEVGHNFFPMIINSDERQCAWMDEGINSFIQFRTESECYVNFPSRRGPAEKLMPYLKGDKTTQRPLMTNPEQVVSLGAEAYTKAATALNILREQIMGPELFDAAFKEYSTRWAFKHPKPADFFRTMEDASAVDLDWFWKGWFYTTDNVDVSVDEVKWFQVASESKSLEGKDAKAKKGDIASGNGQQQNPFYDTPQPLHIMTTDSRLYGEFRNKIDDKAVVGSLQNKNLYEVTMSNKGGLVTPVILEWTYKDGSKEVERIPAEIWRTDEEAFTKVFVKEKEVAQLVIDPDNVTTDTNVGNNVFPKKNENSKFDSFKEKTGKTSN